MALASLTACSSDQADEGPGGRDRLLLVASSGAGFSTRASDNLYASGFDGGEQVAVWMKGSGAAAQADYLVGSPSAGKSSLSAVGTALEYPAADETVKVYAVYPSSSASVHVVPRDQRSTRTSTSGDAGYKRGDLMYARVEVAPAGRKSEQTLAFGHLMTKLRIQVTKAAGVSQISSVTLNGVKRRVTVTASENGCAVGTAEAAQSGDDGYIATAADNNSVLVGGEEASANTEQTYTYACVLPAQTWTDADFLTIVADGETYVYKTTKALTGGQLYTVSVTVEPGAEGSAPLWAGPLATRSDSQSDFISQSNF